MNIKSILPGFLAGRYDNLLARIKDERKYKASGLSMADKIWLWRRGFAFRHKAIYGLTRENINFYLDDVRYKKMHPINGLYSKLIDNKAFLPVICPYTCDLYIVIEKGLERSRNGLPQGELIALLEKYSEDTRNDIICKPISDSLGFGFRLLSHNKIREEIEKLIKSRQSFIINERIKQHDYSAAIFSGSINTIRLILYRDVDTRKITVFAAHHRFGTRRSQPIDNPLNGGLIVTIDINDGTLGRPFVFRESGFLESSPEHPDSGTMIEGYKIPDWNARIRAIVDYFDGLSWFEYGGPDIVLTENSFKILEINSCPISQKAQKENPFLADEGFRKFFISKGLQL